MGSYRPPTRVRHFHLKFNFTEMYLETVGQSLRHSCRTLIKCQGISLPSDRQSYSRRLPKLIIFIFRFWALGRRQTLYIILHLAESCVFIKQSLPPFFNFFTLRKIKTPFSRNYGVILPSSFKYIYSPS